MGYGWERSFCILSGPLHGGVWDLYSAASLQHVIVIDRLSCGESGCSARASEVGWVGEVLVGWGPVEVRATLHVPVLEEGRIFKVLGY